MAEYLLGMSAAEIERLGRQHDAWRVETEQVWRLAGFRAGQTIVDLGCGPGFTSLALANWVGSSGRVIAVDASATATDYLRRIVAEERHANIDIVTHDVCALDLGPWRPDAVFARWLFSFLPAPEDVVDRIAGGIPGGTIVAALDYWNYLAIDAQPESPMFRAVFRAVHASFAEAGGSLDVAGRLPRAFEHAGVEVTQIVPVGGIGRPGSPVWQWIEDFLTLYLPSIIESGALTEHDVTSFWTWWHDVSKQRGTFVSSPPMLAVVGVKRP